MKRMLLDENLPKPLTKHFSDEVHISSVHDEGWASKKNGELIEAMVNNGIDYLITVDKNLEHQQNLDKYPIKLVVLLTYDNRYKTLRQHVSKIEIEIEAMEEDQKLLHIDLR